MVRYRNRTQLQTLLESLTGVTKVYFQPPTNVNLQYPCIIYKKDSSITNFANNNPYSYDMGYQLTVIDRDPDSKIHEQVASLPMCTFDRHFTADNLNHDVFTLFF